MSEVNTLESSVRESFSSGFLKPLEDMISSTEVSDFFGRLKLNEKWLNGFKSNLQSLGWILGDAESKAYVNKQVKVWLDELNEVSYDLEDLLDEIVTQELSHQDKPQNIKIQNQGIFSAELSLVEIVEEITVKIENLQRQSETLGLRKASRIKLEPCQLSVDRGYTQVIGRDEDKEAIIKLLLSDDDHQTHVINMVGERGVGKTTLARLVYNDERVEKQFDFKAFIHLSDDFDELLLTKAVLHAFTCRCSNNDDLYSLQTRLKEHLYRMKFLLVLDNLSMFSDWRSLQEVLTAGEKGSRIIVTTRNLKLKETTGTLTAFSVSSLTNQESWKVFAKHAFPDKNFSLHPKLEYFGKLFVKNCRGLPLAAKVLGSVLCFKLVGEWHALLRANIFKMGMNPINFFLKMSYNDLPIHLKRCVAYCYIFPTYHEYEEEKLIFLWMAEGFLQQMKSTRMEEVGRKYFRNLTYRSFFQPSGANKSRFIMHDLLKHIAKSESGFICSRIGINRYSKVSSRTRHVLIPGDRNIVQRCKATRACKYLRTLILYRSSWDKESCQLSVELLNDLFETLQRLRVLSLSRNDITILPHSIGKLKYLRFLDLSYTAITELPNSVSSFHNLQTLLLSHCSVTKLPENMRELINLRHLDITGTCLKEMPSDMGRLTSLQSLSDFVVGEDSGSKIKELGPLSNLRGTLHISQLQNVVSAGDASEASLKNKAYLQGLELEWSNATVDSQNETGVLERLEPHRNLEKLSIISYGGTRFPNWLGDSSFVKMVFLRLSNCNSCSHLPPLGQLPSLKELEIQRMNGVKMVGPEYYGMNSSSEVPFPSLEILVFREMLEWEEWISPEVEGENFPCLKWIRISECPKFAKCSPLHLPPSAEVEISECVLLRVPVIDGNKMKFASDNKLARRPPMPPVGKKLQLPDSYVVQLKNEGETASHLEHRTHTSSTSHNSPPESSMLLALPKLPVMVEKQLHESNSRKEKLLDRPSTSRLPEVEELQLPDINVAQSTDVSITSSTPPPESPTLLTEDSSAKHGGASDTSSDATEISSDTDTNDPNNDEGDKAQLRRNEKLLDRPSYSRSPEVEELQLPDINVVQSTDVSITSSTPPPEFPMLLTEDSSAKHGDASDTSSDATEISSDTDTIDPNNDEGDKAQLRRNEKLLDRPSTSRLPEVEELQLPVSNVVWRTDVSATSNSPPPESSKRLTEDSSAKHGGAWDTSSDATEISSDTATDTNDPSNDEGDKAQLRRNEKLLDRPSTSRLPEVEELQLPDMNVAQSTDVSITSSTPPPEFPILLTEDSSAKHGDASDTSSDATEISSDTDTIDPNNDGGDKAQLRRNEKLLDRPSTSRLPEVEELQLPVSNVVWRTDVSATSNSPPPESSKRLTEDSSAKHGGAWDTSSGATEISSDTATDTNDPSNDEGDKAQLRRNEKLLGRPSTSRLPKVEELQLPDINVVQSTDVSITSGMPPPEFPMLLTEDSSAKHGGASDTSSDATEISSDTDTIDPNNDEGDKAQLRRNEKLLDRPSTSRLSEVEELQLPVSNVVWRTDVSATSNSPPPESSKRLTEDSSAKHICASDNSSAATDISSDTNTDDPINVWYDEEILEDISSPEQESLNVLEISQLKRLPPKLYNLKIEACKALKSLPEELMHSNLRHLYIIDCQFLKSIQASQLPMALETLLIRKCKKLEFLSAEETMDKHTSVEHLCIESSCDPLKSFPLALFPKLKILSIWDCANLNSISITEDHKTLNSLEIRDCTNLESLWKSGLCTPKLASILLSNCKNLKQLPDQLHGLTSLKSLFINECPELDSIPKGGLPSSLNLLRISSCHKLTPGLQWGLHQLNNFSCIEIEGGCRDLESFPEQNLLPRNLNSLQISRFPNLKVLNYKGLQHLISLETLKINSCDKLQSLPEEGLPSSLSYLYISDCPLLKSKLQNRRGKEWYKIAYIPHIQIDGRVIS